jgi:8-oxo-dGTP pyrophosphatase MutT (NUDIX family)
MRQNYNLKQLIEETKLCHNYVEWGFPKGKKYFNESDIDCAIREFTEETGINRKYLTIMNKFGIITETLNGTNNLTYNYYYYVSFSKGNDKIIKTKFDKHEIGSVKWFNYHKLLEIIRPCHLDKIEMIKNLTRALVNLLL